MLRPLTRLAEQAQGFVPFAKPGGRFPSALIEPTSVSCCAICLDDCAIVVDPYLAYTRNPPGAEDPPFGMRVGPAEDEHVACAPCLATYITGKINSEATGRVFPMLCPMHKVSALSAKVRALPDGRDAESAPSSSMMRRRDVSSARKTCLDGTSVRSWTLLLLCTVPIDTARLASSLPSPPTAPTRSQSASIAQRSSVLRVQFPGMKVSLLTLHSECFAIPRLSSSNLESRPTEADSILRLHLRSIPSERPEHPLKYVATDP